MEAVPIKFEKDTTILIKGVDIFFMILLHVFGGSGWYEDDLPMNHCKSLLKIMRAFKICVGIYVYLIGYGYHYAKKKNIQYSIRHIRRLLSQFGFILIVFASPASFPTITKMNGGGR